MLLMIGPSCKPAAFDSQVRTILSQNTTDVNSRRSFAALKKAFPTWPEVLKAKDGQLPPDLPA